MNVDFTQKPQFEIIKFLYQFKDDNKFYTLEDGLLNSQSPKEKYQMLYSLRNNAYISTDREVYNNEGEFFTDTFNIEDEIRARILPKGIAVIESMLEKG